MAIPTSPVVDAYLRELARELRDAKVGGADSRRLVHEVVRTLEETIVDFLRLDEAADVDRAALFEGGRAEIFLRQDDEAAFLVLVALDELLPGDRLSFARADTLEAHG